MQTYGVIGNPVEHSLSPPMHRVAFDHLGIDADYSRFRVKKGYVKEAIEGGKALGIDGLNITVPHKEVVADLSGVQKVGKAKKIGAVNTLDLNSMKAYNTDSFGAKKALKESDVKLEGKKVLIVGAGGAARAVVFGLIDEVEYINIVNRTPNKAYNLADKAGKKAEGHSLDSIEELIYDSDILVNTTSVGMEEDKSPVPKKYLHSNLVVFDLVYTPVKTRLLRQAEEKGAKIVDGVSMLVFQGVKALKIWTGEEAPSNIMEKKVRDLL